MACWSLPLHLLAESAPMDESILEKFYAGDALAASRLMSVVERGGEDAEWVLSALFPRVGRAYRVGVTGLAGAGKSTIIAKLTVRYRNEGKKVGVVAVDPSSPFSGGALLGDRIRMQESSGDAGVFIRSIASRGSQWGLSACATELADVLDAFGKDLILLETVGVGQMEYRVRFQADTTVVVLVPEAGDDIQSLKAGLMEIGEVFVVNKADRTHAERYADDLRSMLDLRYGEDRWLPPVVATIATRGEGLEELNAAVEAHRSFLDREGLMKSRREEGLRRRVVAVVEEKLRELMQGDDYIKKTMEELFPRVVAGELSPYQAAQILVDHFSPGREGKE